MDLDALIASFKQSVIDIGTQGVFGLLVAEVPFLGAPVASELTKAALNWVVTKMVTETELAAYFVYTDQRTSLQAKAYEDAAVAYASVTSNSAATEEEIKNAQQAKLDAARALIRLTA